MLYIFYLLIIERQSQCECHQSDANTSRGVGQIDEAILIHCRKIEIHQDVSGDAYKED